MKTFITKLHSNHQNIKCSTSLELFSFSCLFSEVKFSFDGITNFSLKNDFLVTGDIYVFISILTLAIVML